MKRISIPGFVTVLLLAAGSAAGSANAGQPTNVEQVSAAGEAFIAAIAARDIDAIDKV